MKIAQVITLFLPDFVGGATLACARIGRALVAKGHESPVFCGRPHADAPAYAESTWTVGSLRVTGVSAPSGYVLLDPRHYHHPEVTPVFERFLARERPDVVHFHSIQALGANLLETAAARHIPVVLTMHDWWWYCLRLFLVDPAGFVCPPRVTPARCHCAPGYDFATRRRYLDTMLAHADRILTPSRFLADAAIANGVDRARVRVCANGVDVPRRSADRRPGPIRLGYVGGPDNRLKGLPTLLAATAAMDCGGFELLLYAVPRAEARVPAHVADRVRALPAFPPEGLAAILADLDCLVVPSLMRESYSLVTREALAAGVPVVASDSGGPGEIVRPEVNGLLFATGDVPDLAACLRRLVLQPALREQLRAGARATRVPTIAEQVSELEVIYGELVRPCSPGEPGRARAAGETGHPLSAGEGRAPRAGEPVRAPFGGDPGRARQRGRGRALGFARVLFLTGMDGAPYRYRVANLRDQLALSGIATHALYGADPEVPAAIAGHDLVVVYRVAMDGWVSDCLAWARRLGRPLVFSCDDLVFDAAATPHAALAALPDAQRSWWLAAIPRYAATLRACDLFIGSTEPLVAAAARLGTPGVVVRNGVGEAQLAIAEETRKARARAAGADAPGTRGGRPVSRVAYLSGTTMHDLDFAAIEPVLASVLAARPRARLVLGGFLRTGQALVPFASRIDRLPFVPWHEIPPVLAAADVSLAPLGTDAFSDAKSEVKYLEAAVLGVPTIATPTAAFRHAIRDGVNGRLAATPDAWRTALLDLLDDSGLRRRLGNAARDDAFLRYTPAAQADTLLEALEQARAIAARAGSARQSGAAPDPADHTGDVGRFALEPDDAHPGAAQLARDTPSCFLTPGRAVGQTFRATADGLARIDVALGTNGDPHRHRLVVRVHDGAGRQAPEVRRATIAPGDHADGAWAAAEIAPIADSAGRTFYVWLESEGASDTDAVTLWTYVRGWGERVPEGLHVDHRAAPGSLTFRTYHR